jgi:xanthine/uracil permease
MLGMGWNELLVLAMAVLAIVIIVRLFLRRFWRK